MIPFSLQSHDPDNLLGHKEKWKSAIDEMNNKEKHNDIVRNPRTPLLLKQSDCDDYILGIA